MRHKISIDLGTSNIVICDNKNGVILDEPSVIAFHTTNNQEKLLERIIYNYVSITLKSICTLPLFITLSRNLFNQARMEKR